MKLVRLAVLVAVGVIALAASRVMAGERTSVPVVIMENGSAGFAYGALGSARNGLDPFSDIGCSFTYAGQGVNPVVTCSATNGLGTTRMCTLGTVQYQVVLALAALSSDSLLYFAWDSSGDCIEIKVTNGSEYEPKLL